MLNRFHCKYAMLANGSDIVLFRGRRYRVIRKTVMDDLSCNLDLLPWKATSRTVTIVNYKHGEKIITLDY